MNTNPSTPDSTSQATDILRAEVAQLEKIRQQIASDMETLRTQEANLRVMENRIRDSRPPLPAAAPSADQAMLDAERDKLSRLRALTEAERRALVDERLAVREEKAMLERKAEELKQREAWLDAREKDFESAKSSGRKKAVTESKPLFTTKIFNFGSKRKAVG
jgi:hypothetical protein